MNRSQSDAVTATRTPDMPQVTARLMGEPAAYTRRTAIAHVGGTTPVDLTRLVPQAVARSLPARAATTGPRARQ